MEANDMNLSIDTRTLAEMFADMTDIFCDSVDTDGLSMLLAYCTETSGMKQGVVILKGDGYQLDTVVDSSGRKDPLRYVVPQVAVRALRTLQTEFSVSGDNSRLHYDYAFPLRVRGSALGVVCLFSEQSPGLEEHGIAVLQSIADIAATTIDQTHRLQQARTLVTQLQGALNSRIVIEQAKGVLAARNNIDVAAAFNEIRSTARREQRPVRSVAKEIVQSVVFETMTSESSFGEKRHNSI